MPANAPKGAGVNAPLDPLAESVQGGVISTGLLLAIVALGGAGTMVVELGAVRLLAPWFGTSSSVWTNVIGVVLAALALGYALGARLASTAHPARRLGGVLIVAGVLAAWLPLCAQAIAGAFMPDDVPLHDVADVLVWGSLAAATVLFLPAATALGCAGPLAVETLQRSRGGGAGAAGGQVLAASTIGSLVGTFGTTHLLIPSFGIAMTFVIASVALTAAGALLVLLCRSSRGGGESVAPGGFASVASLLLLAPWAFGAGATLLRDEPLGRAARDGEALLARAESPLQSLRVIETGEGDERMRFLRVNESLDSFQSLWVPEPGLLGPGHYYNHFVLPWAWQSIEDGSPPATWDTLIIGLGAGTAVRVLEGVMGDATQLSTVGIEIDPDVVRLGLEHFDLEENDTTRIVGSGLDGRAALRALDGRVFDQVIVDAYANNMEIPSHLASVEAFREMGERLVDGGYLSINVGGFGAEDPVVQAIAASASVGLGASARLARVPFSRNWMVFLRKGERNVPEPGEAASGSRGPLPFPGLAALVRPLELPGAWATMSVDDARSFALTDDSSATEVLQSESIRMASDRLSELDRISDAEAEAAKGDQEFEAPSPQDLELEGAARAFLQKSSFVDALDAAREIESLALRARLEAEIHWYAGSLFTALEVAGRGLEAAPRDPLLLRLAIDLGFSVGAQAASQERLERLTSLDATKGPGWAPDLERLAGYGASASKSRTVKESAMALSVRVVSGAGGLVALLIMALALLGNGSAPRREAARSK